MEKYVVALVLLPFIAYLLCTLGKHPLLVLAGRLIFLVLTLALGGTAIVCFVLPFTTPSGSGAFILWLPGLMAAVFTWITLGFWNNVRDARKLTEMPEEEQIEYTKERLAEMIPACEEDIRIKSEEASRFWISPGKRSRLRSEANEARLRLEYLLLMRNKV